MRFVKILALLLLVVFSAHSQFIEQERLISPLEKDLFIWLDANDYAVQTFTDGTVLTHKGDPSIVLEVEGSALEVQLDGSGKKEFEFNGSYIKCTSGVAAFKKFHDQTNHQYTVNVIGKFGTSSNPDALFSICGNNATGSTNIGFACWLDNRTATAAGSRGAVYQMTKGTVSVPVFSSLFNNGSYNVDQSLYFVMESFKIIDENILYKDGDFVSVQDIKRSGANTTSGLGSEVVKSNSNPTYAFEIGALGNGTLPLATGSTMKQFIIYDELLGRTDIRYIDKYFGHDFPRGDTDFISVTTNHLLEDEYILGGTYARSPDNSEEIFITSVGPNHFTPGDDREGVQVRSLDGGVVWPDSYTTVFADAAQAVHGGVSGGYSPAGTLIAAYGRYSATTGAYNAMIVRRSTDKGATWGSEISLTIPTTSPALTAYVFMDNMFTCNNGDIAIMAYALSGTSLYKIYVVRSADDGLTWNFTEVYTSGSAYVNESSAVVHGDDAFIWSRVEVASGGVFVYKQFYSDDDLTTFTDQGNTTFGGALYAHPPMLRKIFIDGVPVVQAMWVNRLTRRWHCKFALFSALVSNGISEWTSKTTYTLIQRLQGTSTGWISGYPVSINPYDNLIMRGVWFEENSSSTTRTAFFEYQDEITDKIRTELGI